MSEIINLRQARKQRRRGEKAAKAEENRVKFGRGKGQKRQEAQDRARQARDLDGKKLD